MDSPNFFARCYPDKREKNYSVDEVIYHLEILPQNKKSITNKSNFFTIFDNYQKSQELSVKNQ